MNVHCMGLYMQKTVFFLSFIHLKLKFRCWGLLRQTPTGAVPLDPAWKLPSPDENLTPLHRISRPYMSVVNDLTD